MNNNVFKTENSQQDELKKKEEELQIQKAEKDNSLETPNPRLTEKAGSLQPDSITF